MPNQREPVLEKARFRQGSSSNSGRWRQCLALLLAAAGSIAAGVVAHAQNKAGSDGKLYEVVDGKVDKGTYNGYRRYHAGCNHCHGPAGLGSTVAGPLVDQLPEFEKFRQIVLQGTRSPTGGVMPSFENDPNVEPYINDIYAYLQARTDGVLGRGRPERFDR